MTPEEKLREFLDSKHRIGRLLNEDIIDHVKAHWYPKPVAGTVQALDDPPPQGPGGGPVGN